MKKKILFAVDRLTIGGGGLQRVNSTIADKLLKNHETVIFSQNSKNLPYKIKSEIIARNDSFEKIFFDYISRTINRLYSMTTKKTRMASYLEYIGLFREIKNGNYDTIILNSRTILATKKIKKLFPDIKVIIWIHNNYDLYFNKYFPKRKMGLIEALECANTVVALTESDRNQFGKYASNIVKINNPITIEHEKLSDLEHKMISITCRYSVEIKGLDYLVKIAKNLPNDWKIAVAGSGPIEEVEKFKKLIETEGVKDKMILRGHLIGDDLVSHYLNSSIYLMTSRWEGMPLVLAEAMSFGLPIIAFEQTGSIEVLERNDTGILCENGNIEEISKQLNELISDFELRKEYSIRSLKRVRDFEIDKIIDYWEEIV